MLNSILVDAKGMKCPRPIIELAKARKRAAPGVMIEITADDLAFETDVKAWCESTGNALDTLTRDGNVVVATIRTAEQ